MFQVPTPCTSSSNSVVLGGSLDWSDVAAWQQVMDGVATGTAPATTAAADKATGCDIIHKGSNSLDGSRDSAELLEVR